MRCQTLGFVVKENDEILVIAGSAAVDPSSVPFCDPITIPKVSIITRKKVKL